MPDTDITHIDYDALAESYNTTLVTRLRGHTAGADFLELWVPDEDPVKGIADLVYAARSHDIHRLTIRISTDTLDDSAAARLKVVLGKVAALSLMRSANSWDIGIVLLAAQGSGSSGQTHDAGAGKEKLIKADRSRPTYEINPLLQPGIAALGPSLKSRPPLSAAPGAEILSANEPGLGQLSLAIDLGNRMVLGASCSDAATPAAAVVLDCACRHICNRPIRDVAEHGSQLTMAEVRRNSPAGAQPVQGVFLAANAGTAFVALQKLLRRLAADFEGRHPEPVGINFFETGPGSAWQVLDAGAKMAAADAATAKFLSRNRMAEDQMGVLRIEKDILGHEVRVIVAMADEIPAVDKGILARSLEQWLKHELDSKIQLYLEPLRDQNSIRRL